MAAWSWLLREPHGGHPAGSPEWLCGVGSWYCHPNMPSSPVPPPPSREPAWEGVQGQGQPWGGLGCAGGPHSPPQPPVTPPAHAGSSSCYCSLPCQSPMPAHSVPLSPSLKLSFARKLIEMGKGMPGRCLSPKPCLSLPWQHPPSVPGHHHPPSFASRNAPKN